MASKREPKPEKIITGTVVRSATFSVYISRLAECRDETDLDNVSRRMIDNGLCRGHKWDPDEFDVGDVVRIELDQELKPEKTGEVD
jgi:hypothetical protein